MYSKLFHFFLIMHNGLTLCSEADFEALNCLPAQNLIRSTKLHLSTEPAFLPNACYLLYFSLRQFNCRLNFFFFDVKSYGFGLVNWAVISINCRFVKGTNVKNPKCLFKYFKFHILCV